jgi:hypothetical protein
MQRVTGTPAILALALVLSACNASAGPEAGSVYVLQEVTGHTLPVRIETYAGRVFLAADTLRIDAGNRYRRSSILLVETDIPGQDSVMTSASAGEISRVGSVHVLVPDGCRPDRDELSLCIPPDTITAIDSRLRLRTTLLPGSELLYFPLR